MPDIDLDECKRAQRQPPGASNRRVLRRWYRAKRLTKQITVQRVERATGRVGYRRCRKRKQSC